MSGWLERLAGLFPIWTISPVPDSNRNLPLRLTRFLGEVTMMWRFTRLDTAAGAVVAFLLFGPLAGGYFHTAMATSESTAKTSIFNPLFWLFALTLILVLCAAGWSAASVHQSKKPDHERKTPVGGPNDPMA